ETYGNASAMHAQDFDTTVPTVAEIQTEMEENGASLLDTIRDDLDNVTDGLGALKALIDAVPTAAVTADAVRDEVVEGTTTFGQAFIELLSHHTGKSSGGGTATLVYRNISDNKDVLTFTVDANGNRSVVVRNP
ncbi:hypothetical protein LCGC14_3023990, partial [marine sediment metagenome]